MKRFCLQFIVVITLLLGVAPLARAQSVFESFKSRYDADMKKRIEKYNVSSSNDFMRNWDIYNKSGGPTLDESNIPVSNIRKNGSGVWWLIMAVLGALSAAQIWVSGSQPGQGGSIIPSYMKLGLKLIVLMCLSIAPQFFYASAMTVKNSFTLFATLLTDMTGKNGSAASTALNQTSSAGPANAKLGYVISEGVQEGFNQWTVPLAGPGRASTMQVYNGLAKALNVKMSAEQFGYNNPFIIADFPTPGSTDASGKAYASGDKFDGDYTNVYEKAANFQIPVVDRASDQTGRYAYAPGSNWDDILKGDFPRMIQFILCTGSSNSIQQALSSVGAWNVGADAFNEDTDKRASDLANEVMRDGTNLNASNVFVPSDSLQTSIIRYIASTKAPAFVTDDQQSALLARIKSLIVTRTSSFVRLTFVDQMPNHNDPNVRTYSQKFISGNGANASMPTERKEDSSYIGKKIKWLSDWIASPIRWFCVFLANGLFETLIELNMIVLWLAAPLWIFDKTEAAFRGALNTLFVTTLYSPTLAALLTIWDTMTGVYIRTLYPSGTGILEIAQVAMAPQMVVNIVIMNILGVILCCVLTPMVCKAFFNGSNAAGALLGGFLTSAVAGATIAGRAALPAAGAAASVVMAGAKSMSSASSSGSSAAGGIRPGVGASVGSGSGTSDGELGAALEGRAASQSAGLSSADAVTARSAETSYENSLAAKNRRIPRRNSTGPGVTQRRTVARAATSEQAPSMDEQSTQESAATAASVSGGAQTQPDGMHDPEGGQPAISMPSPGNAAQSSASRMFKTVGKGLFLAAKATAVGTGVFAVRSFQEAGNQIPDIVASEGSFKGYLAQRKQRDLLSASKRVPGKPGSRPGEVRNLREEAEGAGESENQDLWRGNGNAWQGRS